MSFTAVIAVLLPIITISVGYGLLRLYEYVERRWLETRDLDE